MLRGCKGMVLLWYGQTKEKNLCVVSVPTSCRIVLIGANTQGNRENPILKWGKYPFVSE